MNLPLGKEAIPPFSILDIVFLLNPKIILKDDAAILYLALKSDISFGAIAPFATIKADLRDFILRST